MLGCVVGEEVSHLEAIQAAARHRLPDTKCTPQYYTTPLSVLHRNRRALVKGITLGIGIIVSIEKKEHTAYQSNPQSGCRLRV